MFTPTWNLTTASVRCESSTLVVLNATVSYLWRHTQTKEDDEKRKNPKSVMLFLKWNTNIKLQPQSWLFHAITSHYICSNDLCRPVENTYMLAKEYKLTCCPAVKHKNAANLGLQTSEKNQRTFLWHRKCVNLNHFSEVPLQKFLFL